MELKILLKALARKWWLILPTLAATLVATAFMTQRQPLVYKSSGTYLVTLGETTSDKDLLGALTTVSRQAEIATTYAEVANSGLIRQAAIRELGLSSSETKGLSLDTRVIPGTTVLRFTGQGRDPEIVRDFTAEAGRQTARYIGSLYDLFSLEELDPPTVRRNPSSPNFALNMTLGGLVGVVLGIGLALLATYLQGTPRRAPSVSFDADRAILARPYVEWRLKQEVSRSERYGYNLSIAFLRHHGQAGSDSTRRLHLEIGELLRANLREEDTLGEWDDASFMLLLPDATRMMAQMIVEQMERSIEAGIGGSSVHIRTVSSIACHQPGLAPGQMIRQALVALAMAESAHYSSEPAQPPGQTGSALAVRN